MPKIVNFFGGPGVSKSTTAANLFGLMKMKGESVEIIPEFPKELTYTKRFKELKNQYYIFGEMLNRVLNVYEDVNYIIMDSPLLLSAVYEDKQRLTYSHLLKPMIEDIFFQFDTKNILVTSDYSFYDTTGRNQTKEESQEISNAVKKYLDELDMEYLTVQRGNADIQSIYEWVIQS